MNKAWLLANKWIFVVVLSCFSGLVKAVSLGGVAIYSYLNEPLSAEIQIHDLDPNLVNQVTAELGSPQDFMKANIERQTFLNNLNFEVVSLDDKLYIYIDSQENLKNPYLELLLKIRWKDGSLLKSYTLLVDPLPGSINQKTRAHAISEKPALERRNITEEKRINIKNLKQVDGQTISETTNLSQNLFSQTTGVVTFSDASFDTLAEQTNTALEKNDKPTIVNFDAEDEIEKNQIISIAPHAAIEPKQPDQLLPIKTSGQVSLIEIANVTSKYISNPVSIINSTTLENITTPLMRENNLPLDTDKALHQPLEHNQENINKDDAKISEKSKEIPQFKDSLQEAQKRNENPAYKSQLLNFTIISGLTLSLLTGLIIIYRRYRNRSDIDTDYAFDKANAKKIADDLLDDEDDIFEDDFNSNNESIDRKSIDADIETYQKQLSDVEIQQYVDDKKQPSIVNNIVENIVVASTTISANKLHTTPLQETPLSPEISVPVAKINPENAFDIAAARAGNSTGHKLPSKANDPEDSSILLESDNIDHYDLSAYNHPQEQSIVNNTINDTEDKLETQEINEIEVTEAEDPAQVESIVEILPPKDTLMIDDLNSTVEDIKLTDDDNSLQVINRYDADTSDILEEDDNFELDNLEIEGEGTAAFDNFEEANIKLDLARQYYSAGYFDSARDVISEIIEIGNTAQQEVAQELLEKIETIAK